MSRKEIDDLIAEQFLCRIAFTGKAGPYIAPFQYVFFNKRLYFHFTKYGNKMMFFKEGNQVCVEIEKYLPDMSQYAFVILTGNLKLVTDPEERAMAIEKLSQAGAEKLSTKFLGAHGFDTEAGWSALNPEQPILILKLEKVTSIKGLKSP
jgi:nitroimidazol reductase NimA-like FMN-containing flavoprotein (pyridoxamine 5'-phosphate oxidase superfamily)